MTFYLSFPSVVCFSVAIIFFCLASIQNHLRPVKIFHTQTKLVSRSYWRSWCWSTGTLVSISPSATASDLELTTGCTTSTVKKTARFRDSTFTAFIGPLLRWQQSVSGVIIQHQKINEWIKRSFGCGTKNSPFSD